MKDLAEGRGLVRGIAVTSMYASVQGSMEIAVCNFFRRLRGWKTSASYHEWESVLRAGRNLSNLRRAWLVLLLESAAALLRRVMRGRVKWFSNERGYGLVTDELAVDYYFVVRDVVGSKLPNSADEVEFSPERTERGLRATNVRITKANPAQGDEREICAHCGKKIVPRLITYQGAVRRSVCPFCGETHRRFAIPRLVLVVFVFVAFAILGKC